MAAAFTGHHVGPILQGGVASAGPALVETAGDKAQVTSGNQTGANDNFVIVFDGSGSNDCSIVFGANMKLLNPSNNNNTTLTEGSWNFEFHAWK